MKPDLTVILPTHDRAEGLRRTLEGMAAAERDGLRVLFAVVDNASRDDTRAVVESFADRMEVRYLFEPEPGKNRALNRGLAEAPLGDVVVFTDDDVDVDPGWLLHIRDVCDRWPDHAVFGGRIRVVWPVPDPPAWASDPYIQEFGFTRHEYAEEERPYDAPRLPFGPNFWVRRRVLEGGRRFSDRIGPHPTDRILGDETLFLRGLWLDGFRPVYSPLPTVGHRIQPAVLDARGIRRRAYDLGRGNALVYGLPREDLLRRRPLRWRLLRLGGIARSLLALLASALSPSRSERVRRSVHPLRDLGYNVQCLRLGRERAPAG